jgi:hypothetical protein
MPTIQVILVEMQVSEQHRARNAKQVICVRHLITQKEWHAPQVTTLQLDQSIATRFQTKCQALLLQDHHGVIRATTQAFLTTHAILVQMVTLVHQIL